MKKILLFVLSSLLLVALVNCNKGKNTSKTLKKETVKEGTELPKGFKGIHKLELEQHEKVSKDSSK